MSPPTHGDLSGLLRAELATDEVTETGRHLRECPACRDELVDAALGHALLARAGRLLGPAAAEAAPTGPEPVPAPVDLGAAVSDERRARRRLTLAVAAAALVVVAGVVGLLAHAVWSGDQTPGPQQSVTLQAVGRAGGGTVSMLEADGRTSMTIETEDLPAARSGHFYYAWLLDPATNKMLPLGEVGPSGTASFEVSDSLLAEYSAVDVSLEADDGDPQHSPTSVLRATYA